MDCAEVDRIDAIERYVTGRMTGDELEAFEQHFLACPKCLAQIELCRDARQVLARPHVVPVSVTAPSRLRLARLAPLAAAAVIVLGIAITLRAPASDRPAVVESAPQSPAPTAPVVESRVTALARLSVVEPPPFDPAATRSAASASDAFLKAMQSYQSRDWTAAADQLAAVSTRSDAPLSAHLYLAAARLMIGSHEQAAAALRVVVRAGDTPFLEEARYLQAVMALRSGQLDEARRELQAVIALDGDRRAEASRTLAELDRLPPS